MQLICGLLSKLRSPQLRQSIGSLVNALHSNEFYTVVANFGLDPAAGADKFNFGDSKLAANANVMPYVN